MELTRRPHNAAMLRKHFGCEIMFDRPQDLLVFKAAVLDLPFRTHNAELLEHMVPGLESALHKREAKASLIEQAKESISRSMCGQRPSIHSVAKELCVSARTLQRRLEEEGTTYQSPLDDVRRSTARRLLVSTDLRPARSPSCWVSRNSTRSPGRSKAGREPLRCAGVSTASRRACAPPHEPGHVGWTSMDIPSAAISPWPMPPGITIVSARSPQGSHQPHGQVARALWSLVTLMPSAKTCR
jgi:AraC-like DNA-binding protein